MVVEVKKRGDKHFTRIAKRDSGQNWINLEPGFTVRGSKPGTDYDRLEIEYFPPDTH
jgi:hypothetical protein